MFDDPFWVGVVVGGMFGSTVGMLMMALLVISREDKK